MKRDRCKKRFSLLRNLTGDVGVGSAPIQTRAREEFQKKPEIPSPRLQFTVMEYQKQTKTLMKKGTMNQQKGNRA